MSRGFGGITITTPHQRVHEGRFFNADHYFSAVANGANADLLIQVGSTKVLHSIFSISASGDSRIYLYTGTTFSAAGTTVTAFDHNRVTANTSDGTFTHTPTVTGVGTQMATSFLPGGTKVRATGGQLGFNNEWLLATSTNYLLRVTNNSGSNAEIAIALSFYEA